MANKASIHWHEGLFLQPHHLQAQQGQFNDRLLEERRLAWAYPYGVIESKLSSDAIENLLVRFDKLKVVMPSGITVDFPEDTDLPPLDIRQAFQSGPSFTVYLALPLLYPNRANTIDASPDSSAAARRDDWRINRIYRVTELELRDENTGQNPQPALVRRLNARLLLDGDDRTDLEVLPVLRIAHATGSGVGLPRQDSGFVPPCMVLSGSPVLREQVRDLTNQVQASRKELVLQTRQGGFSIETMRGQQFEQVLRLGILNRFSVRLADLSTTPGITPLMAYRELRELLAELAALEPGTDPFEVAAYDHDNPAIAFNELSLKLRERLRGSVVARYMQAPFVKEAKMFWLDLTDQQINQPNEYFLAVQTGEDPRAVAKLVEDADRFRLMAKTLANQRIWGVKLVEERHPPLELPAQQGLCYFRLMRTESARMWERITGEKSMAAKWADMEASDFALTLYMTVPDGGGA